MKRLTERTEYGIVGNNDKVTHYPLYKVANNDPLDHGIVDKCFNKLANYEDLEEQGLLLKLPCKVGDIVYVLEPCHCYNNYKENQNCHHTKTKATKFIDVVRVTKKYNSISNTNCMKLHERHFKMDYLTKIGKTVFLTQEEAEQALEQLKAGGKNE